MDWYADTTDTQAVRRLRHSVVAHLERHAEPEADLSGAELAVAELLGNAARHATGPVWVSLSWAAKHPTLTVYDLGPGFDGVPEPADDLAEAGRGLQIVGHVVDDLRIAARRSGGAKVQAVLPVPRAVSPSYDPPRHHDHALPGLDEAAPGGGFGKESFLRALVVQMAQAVEEQHGPSAAEAAVAQVGIDVGGRMEEEFRAATDVVERMTPTQLGECFVRLKHAIDGEFDVVEATAERIVLVNTACPFGDVVRMAPALCRMTSSVFGGIAAAQTADGEASVLLEERIAVGDPGCRIVVYLTEPPEEVRDAAHRYRSAS
ncbi:MAG TPA: ATP-binding protein [Acidimicrobiales bacterium]|nr:ATP-binding protein [Acidimicrobiales bacterium]